MGLFDRAKQWLGVGDGSEEAENAAGSERKASPESATPGARRAPRGGRDRPPLPESAPPPSATVDDAIAAREAGDAEGARKILRDIDRGAGLRTVLRAAAALEAKDEDELATLLGAVAKEEPSWRLPLQLAGALGDAAAAEPYLSRARSAGAPAWALAWACANAEDAGARREGLVDLLFTDAALARTVASRDLGVSGVVPDPEAAQRYASFAHGRDSIRRFGAASVARLLDRVAPR